MRTHPVFKRIEVIQQSNTTSLYRAIKSGDPKNYLVKIVEPSLITPHILRQFKHELEMGRDLDISSVLKTISIENEQDALILVYEDFVADSLETILKKGPLDIENFLWISIEMTKALGELHREKVIHKDINPRNVLINFNLRKVKFLGLGLSTIKSKANSSNIELNVVEGSLPYMSPEQTGKVNKKIDSRSDYYSLGITFYEMLSGTPPFKAKDPLEFIHAHVAQTPLPLDQKISSIPPILSDLIMTLLSKNPDERYQSARGIQNDLEECLHQFKSTRTIHSFPLKQRDVSEKFFIPDQVFGRKKELEKLESVFNQVLTKGNTEIIMVSGHSGVGKTTFVDKLTTKFQEVGFFQKGKFEQFNKGNPHAPFIHVLRELVLSILKDEEKNVALWVEKINTALNGEGQAITEVIPQLELLIGVQPEIPQLPAFEAKNRFRRVLVNFIRAFINKDQPLIVFLDDLQWADPESLTLLSEIITHPEMHSLLILGTYRNNEVSKDHPLLAAIKNIQSSGKNVSTIDLNDFTLMEVQSFLSGTFHYPENEVKGLADLIYKKTLGNPFFVIQFLHILHDENLIRFDKSEERWVWDLDKISSQGFTDNVADLIIRKLNSLSETTQRILKQMSFFGTSAKLDDLELAFNLSPEIAKHELKAALSRGIIKHHDKTYMFPHDRIYEAIYLSTPFQARCEEHLALGRRLLSILTEEEQERRIFEVASHFNEARNLITDHDELKQLARLNLKAARRARVENTLNLASYYCESGLNALQKTGSDSDDKIYLTISLIYAECEFANGNVDKAEKLIEPLKGMSLARREKSTVSQIQINIFAVKGQFQEVILCALESLLLFDIKIPPSPTQEDIDLIDEPLKEKLNHIGLENIPFLKRMVDNDFEVAAGILTSILPASYFINIKLHKLVCCHIIYITLRDGLCKSSANGFAAYALDLTLNEKYIEGGKIGNVAEKLTQISEFKPSKPMVHNALGASVIPWTDKISRAIQIFEEGVQAEGGDIIFASYCKMYRVVTMLWSGKNLEALDQNVTEAAIFVRTRKLHQMSFTTEILRVMIARFRGTTPFSSAEEEQEFVNKVESDPVPLMRTFYYGQGAQVAVYFGDNEAALEIYKKTDAVFPYMKGQIAEFDYYFFSSLAIIALWKKISQEDREQYLIKLKTADKKLSLFSSINPFNFQAQYFLMTAEMAKFEGRDLNAQQLYEESITAAKHSGLIHIEALAYEKASQYYDEKGLRLIAKTYLKEAYRCYLQWGALAKTKLLEKENPQFREGQIQSLGMMLRTDQLDLLSVVKASQAISSNIVQDKLIHTLMRVLLEQSGAQAVSLVLVHQNELYLEVKANLGVTNPEVTILKDKVISDDLLPTSVIRFVQRTKDHVIFDDAFKETHRFSSDPYIIKNQIKSLLCIPIIREENLLGIIYFENNVTTGVFSNNRLSVLELLASQTAISLQNVQYYQDLHKENIQRKAAQEALWASKEQLQSIIDSATSVIYMKDMEGRYLLINSGFENFFNKEREHILGKTDVEIFSSQIAEKLHENDQLVMASGKPVKFEQTIQFKDEVRTYLSVKFPMVDVNDKAYAICNISTDISDRKEIEAGREQLLIDAQKSIEARDDFISIASHELRTPLTPLRMYLDILKKTLEGIPDEFYPKKEFLKKAVVKSDISLNRLLKLIEDLIDASVIMSNRLEIKVEDTSLSDILNEVVDKYTEEIKNASCELHIKIHDEAKGTWDRARIKQVIENLLTNALRYGAAKPIELTVRKVDNKAVFAIQDHGVGLNAEEISRLFQRFGRQSSIRNYGGLGLGLYISKEIMSAHKGTIEVQSKPGEGSLFTITLPAL